MQAFSLLELPMQLLGTLCLFIFPVYSILQILPQVTLFQFLKPKADLEGYYFSNSKDSNEVTEVADDFLDHEDVELYQYQDAKGPVQKVH